MSPSVETALNLLYPATQAFHRPQTSIKHALSSYAVDTLLTLISCHTWRHGQAEQLKNEQTLHPEKP